MDNDMPLRIWALIQNSGHRMWLPHNKPHKLRNETTKHLRADAILPLIRELCEARKRCADQPEPKDNGEDFMEWCAEVEDAQESFTNTAYKVATRLSEIIAPLIGDEKGA